MALKKGTKEAAEEHYNPFAPVDDSEDNDLSFLYEGREEDEEPEPKKKVVAKKGPDEEDEEEGEEEVKLEQLLAALPDNLKRPIIDALKDKDTLRGKAEAYDKLAPVVASLTAKGSDTKRILDPEEDLSKADSEVLTLLQELGIEGADQIKANKLVKVVEKLAERRARNLYDPVVDVFVHRTAKEERARIANVYPVKKGYPSLEESSQAIQRKLQEHPTLDLEEAYRMVNFEKIAELHSKGEGDEEEEPVRGKGRSTPTKLKGIDANDLLRKLGRSSELPGGKSSSVERKGKITLNDALDQAANELGITLRR